MIKKLWNYLKGIIIQQDRNGKPYTKDEDIFILNKPKSMTFVELGEQMGRKGKNLIQRKSYLKSKK